VLRAGRLLTCGIQYFEGWADAESEKGSMRASPVHISAKSVPAFSFRQVDGRGRNLARSIYRHNETNHCGIHYNRRFVFVKRMVNDYPIIDLSSVEIFR
jgi:hypothetical protein